MLKEILGFTGLAGLVGITALLIWLLAIIALGIYVYSAFAWMTIAKKLKKKKIAWLAFVPIANYFLLPILAKKKWQWGFMFLVPIANIVFAIIWTWKIYELRNYEGWLALIPLFALIPFISIAALIANLVIIGLVAWKDR